MPQLLGKSIGPMGYGLMGLTWRPQPCPLDQAITSMKAALDNGCNFWNGGDFYGPHEYNSLVLLEKYFEKYPEDAEKVVLSIKGAFSHGGPPDGSPAAIRRSMDGMLQQLNGRKKLDIYEMARRDPRTPLATTFAALQEYIDAGKLGGISISEVNLETLKEGIKTGKVVACELELSMFSTEILSNGVAATCAQHNIPIIAYSPLGKGLLTGQIKSLDDIPQDSMLRRFPRFSPENFDKNIILVHRVEELAKRKGCTPGQFALGWVRGLSKRPGMPTIIPIPGATTVERIDENSKEVVLTEAEMNAIDDILDGMEVVGARYPVGVPTNT